MVYPAERQDWLGGSSEEFYLMCAWKDQVGSELSPSGAGRRAWMCNLEAFSTSAVTLSCRSHCDHLGKEYGGRVWMGLR